MKRLDHLHFCVVCMEDIKYIEMQTCARPHCKATLGLNPALRLPRQKKYDKPFSNWDKKLYTKLERQRYEVFKRDTLDEWIASMSETLRVAFGVDTSDIILFGRSLLPKDERGDDERARAVVFGFLSRVTVAIRIICRRKSKVSIKIEKSSKQSALAALVEDRFLNAEYLDEFDKFLAWQCSCDYGMQYVIDSYRDFPEKPGFYGNCPSCGAVAISITNK